MVVLDTDHISVLEWSGSTKARRLLARLGQLDTLEVAATIISFEEQMRGWLAVLSQARSTLQQIEAYRRLHRQLQNYCAMRVLEFDEPAATELQRLQRQRLRAGTMDLKIAAIALTRGATLLSCNLVDFAKVPSLRVEDWTR